MNQGSLLICGGDLQKRKKKIENIITQLDVNLLKVDNPDRLNVSLPEKKKSIGINQIRAALSFLSTRPYSSRYKVVVIAPADKMTAQAQNALLKALEEPPEYAFFILSAKSERSLLPTLLSRCRKISADAKEETFEESENAISFKTVLGGGVGERLKLAEDLAKNNQDFIISQLEYWAREERYEMTKNENLEKYKNIELLIELIKDLEDTNVNTRLALENLFLKV